MRGHYRQMKWARPISCQVVAMLFEYVLLLNQIYLTTMCHSIIPLPSYLINLLWKLGLGLGFNLQLQLQKTSTLSSANIT